ncbi:MAG: hypothetical protein NTX57_12385 [Armatimonadetes bacterium]|nr:hypothetical protein [Armatimonadota bacterium]
MRRRTFLLAALLALFPTSTRAQALFPSECFPIERLPAVLRPRAEEVLLKLLDSEGLYTVIGGMKPMSGGFVSLTFSAEKPDTAKLEELRQILATLCCGESLRCDLLVFHTVNSGKRYAEAVAFSRPAVSTLTRTYESYFAPLGATPSADPLEIALTVEHLEGASRNRGLGYLYGYPKSAVDFFVAGQEEYAVTKKITPRDFRQIPTFGRETGSFVYAVPKGAPETDEDRQLKAKAGRILAEYKKRRERFVGPGKPGIVALLRDWFTNAKGECAPENAKF